MTENKKPPRRSSPTADAKPKSPARASRPSESSRTSEAKRPVPAKQSSTPKPPAEPNRGTGMKRDAEPKREAGPKRELPTKRPPRAKSSPQDKKTAPEKQAAQEKQSAEPKRHASTMHSVSAKQPAESKRPAEPRRSVEAKRSIEPRHFVEPKRPAEPKQPISEESHLHEELHHRKKPEEKGIPTGFAAMKLSPVTREALRQAKYDFPSPIQEGFIPKALEDIDVMGQAQTGTGKTAAFAIPILEKLVSKQQLPGVQALVLVPTRELAVQVCAECARLAYGRNIRVLAAYGGSPMRRQIEQLKKGVEIVIGTPGRVIDLMGRGALMFGDVRTVVLDEADRMLDIGFRPDIEKILRRCPSSRQTLLLSATLPPPVKRLAERYMRDPIMLDFSPKNIGVETIEQFYFSVHPKLKYELLLRLLQREKPRQAIVFCRTRRGTDRLYRNLSKKIKAAVVEAIHGDLQQNVRDRVMKKFREGKCRLLVATDVVGRGIDVSSISHIINYDIPQFCDDYVHRVGRTGRMGREGVAFTFVTPEEGEELTRIEMLINRILKRDEIPGFDPLAATDLPGHGGPGGPHDEQPAGPPAEPKPVFGRKTKRYRRAL